MTSETQQIIALFLHADQMIVDYVAKLDQVQNHINARIENGVPLPNGIKIALHHDKENDISWLRKAVDDLDGDKQVIKGHLHQLRKNLGKADSDRSILQAELLVLDWSTNADRSMETVINQNYQNSDLLPSPPHYWAPIAQEWRQLFKYETNSQDDIAQRTSVLKYLQNVRNPWAGYRAS